MKPLDWFVDMGYVGVLSDKAVRVYLVCVAKMELDGRVNATHEHLAEKTGLVNYHVTQAVLELSDARVLVWEGPTLRLTLEPPKMPAALAAALTCNSVGR